MGGAGQCPECGTPLARAGQLVCQGCFVPFGLLPAAEPGDDGTDSEATDALPQVGPAPTRTDPRAYHAATVGDAVARAMRLRFPGGQTVLIEPGVRIRIGRDPRVCPSVRFLAGHDNLSRIHATVGVEDDGSAWITDEGSTNGTFVHGYRLAPRQPAALRPGDSVRLAGDLVVEVHR